MTPFELDILLHYYSIAEDHPVVNRKPPIWPETRKAFLDEGLMELVPMGEVRWATYRLTERGQAYIKAILEVPLPVKKWVMPEPRLWTDTINTPT